MSRFQHFVAIDWSGAKGKRHKGIAIASCAAGDTTPTLVRAGHIWSRAEALDWMVETAVASPTLFGFDFSFAPPIDERGEYLPGEAGIPDSARALWAYVDTACEDDDLGAASFLEATHRRHFYFGAADGAKRDFMFHRACEKAFNATGGGKASSVYDAIGAAQVAKASFAGMRLLHHVAGRVPIWPFDDLPEQGSLIVEIYTRAFIRLARQSGRKVRNVEDLDRALAAFGSDPSAANGWLSDHETDVLIAAAGLRHIAGDAGFWFPEGLTPDLAQTEGWTFGVA